MKDKLHQEQETDYFDILFPELQKKKVAVKLPSIKDSTKKEMEKDETTPSPAASKKEEPIEDTDNMDLLREEINKAIEDAKITDGIERELQDLKDVVQDLEREEKFKVLKEELKTDVLKQMEPLQKELEELKERKIPERRQFETDGAYKEQLYPIATNVLDKIIIPLINIVPDYNLISTQISSTYEDGTIKNGIVSINMIIPNNDYRYDFRIDLVILNGLIQSPSYCTRGRNLIPLTQKDLYNEINTFSYRKLEPNYNYKKSPFSNTGENPLRRPDNQKFYEVDNKEPTPSAISEDHKWKAHLERGLI